jgi:rod shape-determining protein MreD
VTPIGPGIVAARISLVLVVSLTLQVTILSDLRLFGVQGDLMLLVALAAGLAAGPERGAAIGFASGLLYDLMLQTPCGLSALTYAVMAFLVGSLQDSVLRAAWWIPVSTAAAGSALGVILYVVFGTVVGVEYLGVSIPKIVVLVALLNSVVAAPTIRVLRWATGTQDSVRARAVYR